MKKQERTDEAGHEQRQRDRQRGAENRHRDDGDRLTEARCVGVRHRIRTRPELERLGERRQLVDVVDLVEHRRSRRRQDGEIGDVDLPDERGHLGRHRAHRLGRHQLHELFVGECLEERLVGVAQGQFCGLELAEVLSGRFDGKVDRCRALCTCRHQQLVERAQLVDGPGLVAAGLFFLDTTPADAERGFERRVRASRRATARLARDRGSRQ